MLGVEVAQTVQRLGYEMDDWGSIRGRGYDEFSLCHSVQTGYGAHPASYPVAKVDSSSGVKRLEHEADRSPPSSAEVKNAWIYISTPQYIFMAW
jgi:hypothetical protein